MRNKDIKQVLETRVQNGSAPASKNLQVILDNLKTKPQLECTAENIEFLASKGVSANNICGLFQKSKTYIYENPEMLDAFNRGRSNVASRVRAKIVDAALEENSMQAAIYLDKVMGGDTTTENVNLTITQQPLKDISTEDLLNVTFTEHADDTD